MRSVYRDADFYDYDRDEYAVPDVFDAMFVPASHFGIRRGVIRDPQDDPHPEEYEPECRPAGQR
jgi:hypothetical protein